MEEGIGGALIGKLFGSLVGLAAAVGVGFLADKGLRITSLEENTRIFLDITSAVFSVPILTRLLGRIGEEVGYHFYVERSGGYRFTQDKRQDYNHSNSDSYQEGNRETKDTNISSS